MTMTRAPGDRPSIIAMMGGAVHIRGMIVRPIYGRPI